MPCCRRPTRRLVGPTEEVEKDPFLVTSEITMTLGDKVTIETYGLTGHITGSISERTAARRADARHGRTAGQGRPVHCARAQARHRTRPAHLQRRVASRSGGRHPRGEGIPGRQGGRERARQPARAAALVLLRALDPAVADRLAAARRRLAAIACRPGSRRHPGAQAGSRRPGRGAARLAARQQARHPRHQRRVRPRRTTPRWCSANICRRACT